jgi:hypothetical protein
VGGGFEKIVKKWLILEIILDTLWGSNHINPELGGKTCLGLFKNNILDFLSLTISKNKRRELYMKKQRHDRYSSDLKALYHLALEKENLAIAVKVKELQLKQMHLQKESHFDAKKISAEEIETLIKFLEECPEI